MHEKSNQPVSIYRTSTTNKFSSIDKTIMNDLKFRAIISKTNMYTYHAAKVILES